MSNTPKNKIIFTVKKREITRFFTYATLTFVGCSILLTKAFDLPWVLTTMTLGILEGVFFVIWAFYSGLIENLTDAKTVVYWYVPMIAVSAIILFIYSFYTNA